MTVICQGSNVVLVTREADFFGSLCQNPTIVGRMGVVASAALAAREGRVLDREIPDLLAEVMARVTKDFLGVDKTVLVLGKMGIVTNSTAPARHRAVDELLAEFVDFVRVAAKTPLCRLVSNCSRFSR
jgi:uncharacterized protein YejL (UPF0352 family)